MLASIREHAAMTHLPAEDDLSTAISHYCNLAATEGNRVGASGGADAA
jgi:hypothetical protein